MLFLAFINDLLKCVRSNVRLFADDSVLYREINNETDCASLQSDLRKLEMWEDHWCMSFNANKCSSISITRKTKKIVHNYTLHNQVLDRVSCATYLGVELSSSLTWAAHIDKTTAKGNRQLGFLKRNLPINCARVKETAYKGLVRPIMEYCAPVWDTPHVEKYKHQLEVVQRCAARFTLGWYHYDSHVSDMLAQLQCETL